MARAAEETWSDHWRHAASGVPGSDGRLGAASGIALGIALGLVAWAAIAVAVWLMVH
jgi:hypothetical protein